MLRDLLKLETRPVCLTEIAYEWCSVIYENRWSLGDWENLLVVCLEIGFRHLDPKDCQFDIKLTHMGPHRELVDVVFKSRESEVIADLLHAWTAGGAYHKPAHKLLSSCTGRLVSLHDVAPFSSRLRRLIIRSVELIGYRGFRGVGMDRFIELLNRLHVTVEDMDDLLKWAKLLLEVLQTSEGAQRLSCWYWELLVELAILLPWLPRGKLVYSAQAVIFLSEAQEWSKLECWMGTVWMVWPPEAGGMTEEDFDCMMVLLFRQRPGASQKLEQWMERWSQKRGRDIPESFRRLCKRAHEAARRDSL